MQILVIPAGIADACTGSVINKIIKAKERNFRRMESEGQAVDLDLNSARESRPDSARNTVTLDADTVAELCHKCNEKPGTYIPVPCGCYKMCRQCAMKLSTGGKCVNCKEFFTAIAPVDGSVEVLPAGGDENDRVCLEPESCQRCNALPALFASSPCGCYRVCRKCAMKMATGGKCATCKSFYTSFAAIPENTIHSSRSIE
jgi:hypothetical protein